MDTSITAPSKEELDSTYEILNSSVDEMNKIKGAKVNVSKKNLTLTMTIQADLKAISDEDLESLGISEDFNVTGTEFKKNAEENGATCK